MFEAIGYLKRAYSIQGDPKEYKPELREFSENDAHNSTFSSIINFRCNNIL